MEARKTVLVGLRWVSLLLFLGGGREGGDICVWGERCVWMEKRWG